MQLNLFCSRCLPLCASMSDSDGGLSCAGLIAEGERSDSGPELQEPGVADDDASELEAPGVVRADARGSDGALPSSSCHGLLGQMIS